jgi:hypothetical protein
MLNGRPLRIPVHLIINKFSQTSDLILWCKAKIKLLTESQYCSFHLDPTSVNTWTNVQSIFSMRFLLVTVCVFENIVIMITIWTDIFFHPVTMINLCGVIFKSDVFARVLTFFVLIHCALICPCKVDIHFGNDDAPIFFYSTNCFFWFFNIFFLFTRTDTEMWFNYQLHCVEN